MIEFLIEIRRLVYIFIVFGVPLMYGAVFFSSVPGCISKASKTAEHGGGSVSSTGKSLYEKPSWEW